MNGKKCDKDCLNCKLSTCIHDLEDVEEYIRDRVRKRKAQYYLDNKIERDAKQKEYDKKHRTAEKCHKYYMEHKEQINKKNQERYANNRQERLTKAKAHYWAHREEISARRKELRRQKIAQLNCSEIPNN